MIISLPILILLLSGGGFLVITDHLGGGATYGVILLSLGYPLWAIFHHWVTKQQVTVRTYLEYACYGIIGLAVLLPLI